MPAPLKRFRADPNKLGRGAGLYYRRGRTEKFPKGYYSKYSTDRDKNKKSLGFEVDKVGIPKLHKLLHTMDGKIFRR